MAPLVLPSDVYQLSADGISCHAWSADGSQLALCPNTNQIIIYKVSGSGPGRTFTKTHELTEHDQLVTGIDWAPKTNRIVSCSQDRNAYVWTSVNGEWKPTLVLLRINRAALACKWSPKENKFAVSSGAKCVSVCYFEEENDWWVSKMIKKHKSSVTGISWHPNNLLLATSSTDFKCRVFSAFIKNVDEKGSSVTTCGEQINEYPSKGWVHKVSWSPSGSTLAFVSHDSTVSIVDYASGAVTTVRGRDLPFTSLTYLNENAIVVAGHDMNPALVSNKGGWDIRGFIDKAEAAAGATKTGVSAAFQKFQTQATKGTEDSTEDALRTRHQMLISCLSSLSGNTLVSSGLDGRLAFWPLSNYLSPDMLGTK